MTKAKRKAMIRKYMMRRIFILLPIIILVSIPLFKLFNILNAAIYPTNLRLVEMVQNENAILGQFLYNLPTFLKVILGLILSFILIEAINVFISPIERRPKKETRRRAY